jgi:hypothetical protein
MEKEIMRLQEVLKEREAEISLLEESVKGLHKDNAASTPSVNGDASPGPKPSKQVDASRSPLENGHVHDENGSVSEHDDSLDRLNELML